jgi:proteasome maturation protein
METQRRVYGIAEPLRRGMELKIVREGVWRPAVLGGSAGMGGNVQEDILVVGGRDAEVGWEDVFGGRFFFFFFFCCRFCCWMVLGGG